MKKYSNIKGSGKTLPIDPEGLDTAPPYQYLYIYYLSGRLPDSVKDRLGSGFIGNWEENDTSFLFFKEPADERVERLLSGQPDLILNDRFEMSYEDWHGGPVVPFQTGRFRVMPPWAKMPAGPDDVPILLDPGVVFGAGNHPTTRHCLEAIEQLMTGESVETVLDLGAGTGLLAIASAKFGATTAVAVDNNFLAASTALNNIRHNQLGDRIVSVAGRAQDFIDYPADLVVANIHYDVMKELVSGSGFREKKWFILSGLMRTQVSLIKDRLAECRAEILDEWIQDGIWYTIFGKMKSIR